MQNFQSNGGTGDPGFRYDFNVWYGTNITDASAYVTSDRRIVMNVPMNKPLHKNVWLKLN